MAETKTVAAVAFQLLGHRIAVVEHGAAVQTVQAALHRGSCMLTDDDGRCFELWEFSRAALEDLFFGRL